MILSQFRKWIYTLSNRTGEQSRATPRPLCAKFRLEQLDDRITPSAVTWTGGGDGSSWSDPSNWSDTAVPGSGDDVTINSGNITIVSTENDTVNSLTMSGATLNITGSLTTNQGVSLGGVFATIDNTGTLTVDGAFAWTNGTLSGAGTTNLYGTSTLSGGSLDNQQLDNFGKATVAEYTSVGSSGSAIWTNEEAGTVILQASSSLNSDSSALFNNDGLVQVAEGSGTATIALPFNNSGTVDVQSGTLNLTGGGTSSGSFTIDQASAVLSPGNYTFQGATISGVGTVSMPDFDTLYVTSASTISNLSVSGGTVDVNAALTVQDVTFTSGTISVPTTLTVNGTFSWTGGTMNGGTNGTGITQVYGNLNWSGGIFGPLDNEQVDNFGTATIASGNSVDFEGSAVWDNEASGTFDLDGTLGSFFTTTAAFNNFGAVEVAPTTTASSDVPFNNTGTVDVQSGTFNLSDGGVGEGTFTIAALATFTPNAYSLEGATINGAGTLLVNSLYSPLTISTASTATTIVNLTVDGGSLDVNTALDVQNLTVNNSFSSIVNAATLTVSDTLSWTVGGISGSGTTILEGTSTLNGGFFSTFNNQQINNSGTATLVNGSDLNFENSAIWNNESSGTLILQDTGSIGTDSSAAFNNSGLIQVDAATDTAVIGIVVNNTGTIAIDSGILSLPAGFTNSGTITVAPGAAITKDPTTTTLNSSEAVTGESQNITLTATVAGVYPGVGTPTGSVSFYDGSSFLGLAFLPSGGNQVSIKTSSLATGNHSITAVYSGDSNYLSTTSPGTSETILGPGVTVIGSSFYAVGANTTDSVTIKPEGRSTTGSTGLVIAAILNGVKLSKTYAQPFTSVYVFDGGGNDTITLSSTLTVNSTIVVGNGTDKITTATGNDAITVGSGKTSITTGNGNKVIAGGGGNLIVKAGTGTDTVTLGNGTDNVTLGNGNNTVTLGSGADDIVRVGTGNNVIETGNGSGDAITAGNGDNLIVAGTGLHTITVGKGSNILIDGSVTLTPSSETLGQILTEWVDGGDNANNVSTIRSQIQVTDNTSHSNHLTTGTGLDWFWYTDTQDKVTMSKTDLHN